MEAPSKEMQTGYLEAMKATTKGVRVVPVRGGLGEAGGVPSHGAAAGAHAGHCVGQLVLESVAHGGRLRICGGFIGGWVVPVGGLFALTLGEGLSILRGRVTWGGFPSRGAVTPLARA